jgi:glyoxylase-like metal-dependent hydrolase (beta-lactamase superfamily II)
MVELGGFKLHVLSDGVFHVDGGLIFGIVPRALWSKRFTPDEQNRVPLYLRPLLVDTGEQRVLIDPGIGDTYGEKFRKIYNIEREPGQLLESLANAGYAPEDVTDVLFTHLHFDHCGGATKLDAEGVPRLAFPNAYHYASVEEYEQARNPDARTRGSYRADLIEPVTATGRVHPIRKEADSILPGFTVLRTPGHTVDHISFLIQSQGQHLVFWGDLIPLVAHINPVWSAALDTHPMDTMESKLRMLKRAVEEGWHYHYFYHEMKPLLTSDEVAELISVEKEAKTPTGSV